MKLVRFLYGHKVNFGILERDVIRSIFGTPFEARLPKGNSGQDPKFTGEEYPIEEVKLLAPVEPSKVVAVGLNYVDHAKELNMPLPDEPILFLKPSTSVIGPDENIIYPRMSKRMDYEAELAVVIGGKVRYLSPEEAPEHILGFCCSNDVTARDLQSKDVQWTRAKSFDTFTPIGPWIETEIDPSDLRIELLLNGEVRQSSSTSRMIFDVNHLVSFISQVMTLLPGDVIMTGTPPGVGSMQVGDVVEVRIEGIGVLRNKVTARPSVRHQISLSLAQ
ncbi:MAG: fumarylacetoacetate hydrolase family protein [Actinomycetota bacterium]